MCRSKSGVAVEGSLVDRVEGEARIELERLAQLGRRPAVVADGEQRVGQDEPQDAQLGGELHGARVGAGRIAEASLPEGRVADRQVVVRGAVELRLLRGIGPAAPTTASPTGTSTSTGCSPGPP